MDGEPPQEEDFSQIPLVDRSQHKNWKARVSAYTDVIAESAKTASDTDPFFRAYTSDGPLLKKWVTDANAVAQEKGVEAVLAIAQYSGESSAKCRGDVVPALVEKALGAPRAGTKKRAIELCQMFVEVENTGEGVLMDLIPGIDAKQPKIVAGCIGCMKDLIESFGTSTVGNIKPLLKVIPKVFGHSDKTVRAEGSALVIALYTYLGAALQPSLAELKPVQVSELQKSFDALDSQGKGAGTGRPTRYTRKAQREREAAAGQADEGGEEAVEEAAAPIDVRDLLDPVDVSKLFPADLDERLSSSKWKDRLEVLEEVNAVLTSPKNARISDSNVDSYSSLAQTLGTKCKSDANVNVVIEAAKVVEGIAKGLGKPFGRFRGVVMGGMLDRLKERKATVVEAIGKALDAVFDTVTLSDIVEDVLTTLKTKNPQVKEGVLKFLHRSLCSTADPPSKEQVKPIAEALVGLLGDSAEPVRSTAADCLGTMMKILGERAFNPYIEGVGELQMGKVKEAFGKAEIRYRAGGGKGAPPKAAGPGAKKPTTMNATPGSSSPPIKSSGKFNMDELNEFAPPVKAPPARSLAKLGAPKAASTPSEDKPAPPAALRKPTPSSGPSKPASVPAPSKPAAKAGGSSKTLAIAPSEPVKYRYTPEDAAAKATDLIPAEYHTNLADGAWKIRLEAAEEMVKWVDEDGGDQVDSEVLFRFLGKTPGWGEKNFQVSAKLYDVMRIMAEKSATFGRPSAALAIGPMSDKLGDLKLKKPAGEALTAFAEKTSLAFVLAQAYDPMTKQKAPKAQADSLTWIKQQLIEFGIAGIPLRDLISFVKTALGSPNALVRSSATQVMVTVKVFVGGDISGFIEDLNPQLLTTINSEFDKAASHTAPEPTRTQADLQEASGGGGGKAGKASAGADPLDDLIPRVDLDKLVNQTTVVVDARSDAWKTRKEAFEALNALLDVKSNSRLKGNMGEIGGVLKKAMADTNLAVKMLALGIISKIALGMGQPFDKHARLLTGPVASVCADQKTTTRAVALSTLTAMTDAAGGLDTLYSGLGTALESPNPALRASILGWLAERIAADPPTSSSDLTSIAGPIISCLEDRNGDVRKGAGAILPFVVSSAGYDFVMEQTSRLKPASKATIVPLINNARANAPSTSASAPPPAAAPTKNASSMSSAAPKAASSRAGISSPAPSKVAPKSSIPAPGRSLAMKALSNAPTIRPPSAMSDERPTALPRPKVAGGISRPQSAQPPPSAGPSNSRIIPFITSDPAPRASRLKRDATRWILESSPKSDIIEYLHTQMEPHASPEMLQLLYSKDHRAEEDYMAGLALMAEFYDVETSKTFGFPDEDVQAIQLANVDLAVKYAGLKLLSNNTQLANRCLEVISNVIATLIRLNERFSDVEARLFGPALVFKLGDNKFTAKLIPIFDSLDKIIAGSQIIQLLVQYGLEDKSAGKSCKNESLALIEKAYRKRGSILKATNDRGFCESLAKCVNDSGTRSAALSVMALLQLQGSSKSLDAVIDSLPNASKDMLANRRATMATTKGAPVPGVAKVAAESVPAPSPRLRKPVPKLDSPATSRVARDVPSQTSSPAPAARSIARAPDSPSRLPKASTSSPAPRVLGGIARPTSAAMSALPRPVQRESVIPKPSMQPLARPANGRQSNNLMRLISDIRQDDLDLAVTALKEIQDLIIESPETLTSVVPSLVDTMVDEMERAYSPIENLQDGNYFRLVKHLVQTISSVTQVGFLLKKLAYDDMYALFDCLTLHLVQSDQMGGHFRELSKFINLILIHILSQTDRLIIFKVMFRLLYTLSADFEARNVRPQTEEQAQADLVMKCLWKRSKVLPEDFASGLLPMGAMLRVVEEFVAGIGPSVWRRRQAAGIALGDLPLRSVKTVVQKVIGNCKATGEEVYDILMDEFGDEAANTVVYSYIFRLSGPTDEAAGEAAAADDDAASTSTAAAPTRISRPKSVSSSHHTTESVPSSAPLPRSTESSPPVKREGETEAARLMRELIRNGNHPEQLDNLYHYMRTDGEHEAEVQRAISTITSGPVQTYVRRMLEQRKSQDHPSPSRPEASSSYPTSPTRSPPSRRVSDQSNPRPTASARRSMGPRPSSIAVDRTLPPDAQLADYKNLFFNNNSGGGNRASVVGNGNGGPSLRVSQMLEGSERRNVFPLRESVGRENSLDGDVD